MSGTTGCSVVMVSKQPSKKNTEMIQQGLSRNLVIAEFGAPITSEYKNGKRHEIYTFTQGYSTASKVGRAFWHGAADVATVGLWELFGTPAESVFNGKKMSYELIFDENGLLERYTYLTQDETK
ncbi:hypothetical protein [Acinetobacter sp. YH12096]|uniref:hypothetical protein n=1 Tax=Acinetobacter sp. YH12096 TaxID=2601085 RepID=UPI0015D31751|nr:hypothetical protein [Acinetobacter sp. YH12096]